MSITVRLRQVLWREKGGVGQGRSTGLMEQQGLCYGRRPGDQLSGVRVVVFFNCSAWGEGQGPEGRFFQTRAAEEQSCESAETYGGKRRG